MRSLASLVLALALACGSEASPSTPAGPSRAQGGETVSELAADGKWHHFWIIRQARDAVILGDQQTTRRLLARIADGDVGEGDVPFKWTVFIEEMQDEAMRAQWVHDDQQIAQIVAAIASRCGDCHRSTKGKHRSISLETLEHMAHGRSGVEPVHADHGWAAEELWLGMTVPIHQAWVRGSAALIESPLHAQAPTAQEPQVVEDPSGQRPPATLALLDRSAQAAPRSAREQRGLEALAGVGRKLHETGRPLMMAKAYADLIRRCPSCHQEAPTGTLNARPLRTGREAAPGPSAAARPRPKG